MVQIYDLEVFPNFFCAGFEEYKTNTQRSFEISEWKDESAELREFILSNKWYLVGYNNNSYDDPILNYILYNKEVTAPDLYRISQMIISEQRKKPHGPEYVAFKKKYLYGKAPYISIENKAA